MGLVWVSVRLVAVRVSLVWVSVSLVGVSMSLEVCAYSGMLHLFIYSDAKCKFFLALRLFTYCNTNPNNGMAL